MSSISGPPSVNTLPMDTVDEHTRHLSDHIYHMITFAAIIICRLLSSYETQLASTYNIAELDTLISNLVQWLHGIGLPCHAAYSLANIIAKVHHKLRPRVQALPIPVPMEDFPEDSFTNYYFPEFLGLGGSGGNWELLFEEEVACCGRVLIDSGGCMATFGRCGRGPWCSLTSVYVLGQCPPAEAVSITSRFSIGYRQGAVSVGKRGGAHPKKITKSWPAGEWARRSVEM